MCQPKLKMSRFHLSLVLVLLLLPAPAAAQTMQAASEQVRSQLAASGYSVNDSSLLVEPDGSLTGVVQLKIADRSFTSVAVSTQLYRAFATLALVYAPARLNVQLVYDSRYTVICLLPTAAWTAMLANPNRGAAWNALVVATQMQVFDGKLKMMLGAEVLAVSEVNAFFQPNVAAIRNRLAERGYLVSGVVAADGAAEVVMPRASLNLDRAQLQQLLDGWAALRAYYPTADILRVSTTLRVAGGHFAVTWPLAATDFERMVAALQAGDSSGYNRLLQQSFARSRVVNLDDLTDNGSGADFVSKNFGKG